jgi:hypothetical protein
MRAGRTGIDDHIDHHAVVLLRVQVERLVEAAPARGGGQQRQKRGKGWTDAAARWCWLVAAC